MEMTKMQARLKISAMKKSVFISNYIIKTNAINFFLKDIFKIWLANFGGFKLLD